MAWVRINPDSKVHGSIMGPTWGRQDPGWPHVGHVNLAIWVYIPYFYIAEICFDLSIGFDDVWGHFNEI